MADYKQIAKDLFVFIKDQEGDSSYQSRTTQQLTSATKNKEAVKGFSYDTATNEFVAYLDNKADPPVWTIGYGATKGVKEGDRMTEAEAKATLESAIARLAKLTDAEMKKAVGEDGKKIAPKGFDGLPNNDAVLLAADMGFNRGPAYSISGWPKAIKALYEGKWETFREEYEANNTVRRDQGRFDTYIKQNLPTPPTLSQALRQTAPEALDGQTDNGDVTQPSSQGATGTSSFGGSNLSGTIGSSEIP